MNPLGQQRSETAKAPAQQPTSGLYDLCGIAQFLGVSPKTVYYWVSRREIPYIKVGRHLRFQVAEVIEFFRSGSPHPKPLANAPKSL